ncbi:ArsR/SmtB family transcription factor [Kribbella italica]|uniref:DNA-binding transcriptional ArsR family regulator n=1 Tax=Kribbella italica TaxID=1540520 RepID=A0A7W9J991_9ACTN|nr:winged helix-turn-helix domain-containing protein [Kribbella italica]MBB5837268.1 DNA-binding transcriptional ArsR family regulator [Kribbella italica]
MNATVSPRHTELVLGELSRVRIGVAPAPMASLISLVVDTLGGPRQGIAPDWIRTIRRALPPDAAQAVIPMFNRTGALLPACLTPLGIDGSPVQEQLDRIANVTPDELGEDVELMTPGEPPMPWRGALRRPRQWLGLYVRLLTAAWTAYAPIWQESSGIRARETDRIGAATVTGGLDVLLSNLSTRARYGEQTLYLSDQHPYRVVLKDRPVVLVPLVSGTSASVFNLDEPDRVWLGYPVPGLDRLGEAPPPAADSLALLIGPLRAAILRALVRPVSMGRLARQLNAGPSTATYHCTQLAAAGLVVRHRAGREVRIQRTPRGDALVDLLS